MNKHAYMYTYINAIFLQGAAPGRSTPGTPSHTNSIQLAQAIQHIVSNTATANTDAQSNTPGMIRPFLIQQGVRPGMPPGMPPGVRPGMQPGMQQGVRPGIQPGMQQGVRPGIQPGVQPGLQPGLQPGVQPQPGLQPTRPGSQPQQSPFNIGMPPPGFAGMLQPRGPVVMNMPRMLPQQLGQRPLLFPQQLMQQPTGGDPSKRRPDNDGWSPNKPPERMLDAGGRRNADEGDDRRNQRDGERMLPVRRPSGDNMMDIDDAAELRRPGVGGRSPRMVSALMAAMGSDPRHAGPGSIAPPGINGPQIAGAATSCIGGIGGSIRLLGNQPGTPMLGLRGPPSLLRPQGLQGQQVRGVFMPSRFEQPRFERAELSRPLLRMRGEETPRDLFPGPPQRMPVDPRFMFRGGFGMMGRSFRGPSEMLPGAFPGGPVPSLTDMPPIAPRFGLPPRDNGFGRDRGESDGVRGSFGRGDSGDRHSRDQRSESMNDSHQRDRRDSDRRDSDRRDGDRRDGDRRDARDNDRRDARDGDRRDTPRRSRWGNWQAEEAVAADASSKVAPSEGGGDSSAETATKVIAVEPPKDTPPVDSESEPKPVEPSQ